MKNADRIREQIRHYQNSITNLQKEIEFTQHRIAEREATINSFMHQLKELGEPFLKDESQPQSQSS